jgi:cell division transport system permease protein
MRLRFVFSELAIGLRRNLLMMFAVVIIAAFSMMFLGTGLLMRSQVGITKAAYFGKLQVSVYLCPEGSPHANCPTQANDAQIQNIQATLEGLRPLVTSVQFIDQDQAWQIFKQEFKDAPDLINNTDPSALPESFVVKLSDPKRFDAVNSAVANLPGVDDVQNANTFVKKLFNIMNSMRFAALVACGVSIVAAGVLIGVAVQVAAVSRRRETGIMRLVGASSLYIQLPFLLEGVLAGLVGAVLGFGGISLIKAFIVDSQLRPLLPVLGGQVVEWSDVFGTIPWLVGISVAVSALASFVTLRKYMRV